MGGVKRYGVLSTDFRVPRCTQFMKAPLLGPLMTITVIPVKWKYPSIYLFPTDVIIASIQNIGNRTQYPIMQVILSCMAPSVSLTMITLP